MTHVFFLSCGLHVVNSVYYVVLFCELRWGIFLQCNEACLMPTFLLDFFVDIFVDIQWVMFAYLPDFCVVFSWHSMNHALLDWGLLCTILVKINESCSCHRGAPSLRKCGPIKQPGRLYKQGRVSSIQMSLRPQSVCLKKIYTFRGVTWGACRLQNEMPWVKPSRCNTTWIMDSRKIYRPAAITCFLSIFVWDDPVKYKKKCLVRVPTCGNTCAHENGTVFCSKQYIKT